jgi:serine/threonine protein kinase
MIQELKEIIYKVTETLAYVHGNKICHRDIKPENILYDQDRKRPILVDFGISKKVMKRNIKRDMLTLTGTPYYRAPEMFEGGGYNELVDMWALGVTVFKLMTGFTPFESEYHSDTIDNIMKGELVFPAPVEAGYSKQARMFVYSLLKPRRERKTAREALNDIWFMDIEKSQDEYTRSMTMSHRKGSALSNLFEASVVPSILSRTNTGKEGDGYNVLLGKTKQEVVKSLKSLDNVEEEESMIYGYGEDVYTPGKSPSKLCL